MSRQDNEAVRKSVSATAASPVILNLPGNRANPLWICSWIECCLDRVNELIAAATSDLVRKET